MQAHQEGTKLVSSGTTYHVNWSTGQIANCGSALYIAAHGAEYGVPKKGADVTGVPYEDNRWAVAESASTN
ncbi:hypothetical protein V6Z90_003523 [Aspergillus fumigatus]